MSERNEPNDQNPSGGAAAQDHIQPDVLGGSRGARGDAVAADSAHSFPASDPPSWSGSSSIPKDREAPPEGEQADWTVERETANVAIGSGRLEQTDEPDAALPVPPDDSLQA